MSIPVVPPLIIALALTGLVATALAEDRAVLRNWSAACGDLGACRAETAGISANLSAKTARLVVARAGQNATGWTIAFEFPGAVPDARHPVGLIVDENRRFVARVGTDLRTANDPARFLVTDERLAAVLLPALLDGVTARLDHIDVTGEAHASELSLSGLTASLLWIEERLGIVGAERRAIAATRIIGPPRSEIEMIRAAGVPEPVLAIHAATSGCEDLASEHMSRFEPVIELASPTAILYALPCTAGAYNLAYRLYLRERGEIGGVRTLYFVTYSNSHGWSGTDILFNIEADGPHLTAFYKGRGIGDCGTRGRWTFTDYAYRLDEFAAMDNCIGQPPDDWPVVYRASGGRDG